MQDSGTEYLLSLLDDAIRVINKDYLGEDTPFVSYSVEQKVEEKTETKKLSLRDMYLNCHSCDNWMFSNEWITLRSCDTCIYCRYFW